MKYLQKSDIWKDYPDLDESLKDELFTMSDVQLKEAFDEDIEFGTAGLRGLMGVGTNRINRYIITKAALGFGNYLMEFEDAKNKGVAIAYDNRHNSKDFAIYSANVLMALGIRVYLYEELRPTPQLSFTVRHFNCIGGIMITASHNPKEYNGFKIYNQEGCQCLPDEVSEVVKHINKIENYFEIPQYNDPNLITYLGSKLDEIYLEKVKEVVLQSDLNKDFNIVYSPLHGTGLVYLADFLRQMGYNIKTVDSQMSSDPDFSHALSTNPEDFKAHLEALNIAKELNAHMTLLTDPDADRVAVCVLHNHEYRLLSGNQIASLLIYYILETKSKLNTLKANSYVFSSNVSSPLPLKIAKSFNVNTKTTLTGFKFIGEQIQSLKQTNAEFLFGYEESIGYLISDFVRDKDSLQASLLLCEVCAYYNELNMTLVDALDEIYEQYGYYQESTFSIQLEGLMGTAKLANIMNYFRNNDIELKNFNILIKKDYQTQILTNFQTKQTSLITLPKSNVIKYLFDDESWFVLRPSGTEPKLKIYLGVKSLSDEASNLLLEKLQEEISYILKNII